MTEEDILDLIKNDPWRMKVLEAARSLHLPDWWIGAGFVRTKVWDYLHGYTTDTPLNDVDVIYFDNNDLNLDELANESTAREDLYQKELNQLMPGPEWSVTNEARMHIFHQRSPYKNSEEALAEWVETATCVGVKIDEGGKLVLTAPHGISDLVNLILRPTTGTPDNLKDFERRVKGKGWLQKWPKLKVIIEKPEIYQESNSGL